MHTPLSAVPPRSNFSADLHVGYLWTIAFVAALGGLLFGYDWVVIGGAKPFYEVYFHLTSEALIGWANSCALLGCFAGSLLAGPAADRFGRKKLLVLSALLFAVSSVFTGWAHTFGAFIFWRIGGGVAIGLASNVSPMYIAEISPAAVARTAGQPESTCDRHRNPRRTACQLAHRGEDSRRVAWGRSPSSWNVQYGWRWMFTAVAAPAVLFFCCAPFIPESPRWLAARLNIDAALDVLRRIGGEQYAQSELGAIQKSLAVPHERAGWRDMLSSPGRKLIAIGAALLSCNNGAASTFFSTTRKRCTVAPATASMRSFSTSSLPARSIWCLPSLPCCSWIASAADAS